MELFINYRAWGGAGIWSWGCRVVRARSGGVVLMCVDESIGVRVLPMTCILLLIMCVDESVGAHVLPIAARVPPDLSARAHIN